jgi:hypothetical protein
MQIQKTQFGGWPNTITLSNDQVELVVTLDVGPRIISYRTPRGENVFKTYAGQLGSSGESEWKIRGGHRLWVAPEGEGSYALDNSPVKYELTQSGIRLENDPAAPWGIRKELIVSLAETSSEVTLRHRLVNEGNQPATLASWGLSVMAPGGLEIIPLPALGEHPRDLLPNRLLVSWPYTDMTDPRWRFGWQYITLRQTNDGSPTKLGLAHKQKWVAYFNAESLFVKSFDYVEGAAYPDFGCNFETFSNPEMLEIESLGPLRTLQPGEALEHTEKWSLLGNAPQPPSLQEEDLATWLEPLLARLGVPQ